MAITLVEMGLLLVGVQTCLNLETAIELITTDVAERSDSADGEIGLEA